MSKYIFSFFIILSMNAFGQVVLKENLTKKSTQYWDFAKTQILSSGAYYKDPLGVTVLEHGKWEYFDRFGKLEEVRNYYKGKLNGAVVLKYPNGKNKQEGYFTLDKQDSVYRVWNELGNLEKEGYYKDGIAVGIWKTFYIDGRDQLVEEIIDSTKYVRSFWLADSLHTQTIINGTGEMTTFYNNSILKERYIYQDGILNGPFLEKRISGDSLISGAYLKGKKTGEWRYFYYTGQIEKIAHYENDLLTGSYFYFYDNGQINVEGFHENGMKKGLWTWYTNQGKRDMSGTFKEDLQDGNWTFWYPTGELSYTAQFKKGKKDGVWDYFYKDGSQFKKGTFAKDEKDGLWETWYEDGTLLMSGKYIAGKEDGKWLNYWQNGKIKNEATFKNGELNGEWKSFSFKGTTKLTGFYKNGMKTKTWTDYFENGQIKDISNYKVVKTKSKIKYGPMKGRVKLESQKTGKFTSFSSKDFKKTEEGTYKNGEKDGTWTAYYPGGKIPVMISNYKNGKLNGVMKEFTRRGEQTSEINYKEGLKHGTFKVFDKRGKVSSQKEFEFGQQKQSGSFAPKR